MKTTYKLILLVVVACTCSILIYRFVDKAEPVKEVEDILVTQNKKELSFLSDIQDYTFQNPKIILDPYDISPLSALIIFETKDLTAPTITIVGKDEKTTITNTFTPAKKHYLPVYGLYPDTENKVLLTVNGETTTVTIQTDSLPDDFILPTSVHKIEEELGNELYFLTPASTGYTAAYDINGDVRWYLTENLVWDIKKLSNGHLLLSSNRLINPPYYTTGLVEIDFLGKIYYEYDLPGGYHHDVYEMKDGNLLIASNHFEEGTVEDIIVEMDRNTGEIVKTFDLKNILPTEEGRNLFATASDWFHNNSIWYDEKTNSITLSGKNQDIVINIDYGTSEINWMLGDPTNWSEEMQKYFLTPVGNNFEWQYAQHAAMILPNGDLFLFDNGNNRSKEKSNAIAANDNYSRAVIYRINKNNKTVEQIWEYGKELGNRFYSPSASDVAYLKDNHYLILSGGHSTTNEMINNNASESSNADLFNSILVEVENDIPIFQLELPANYYRVEKMDLYGNDKFITGLGSRLGNMGATKTEAKNPFILFNKDDEQLFETYNLSIAKEIDRLVIKGTFKKTDKVQIILDSLFNKKTYNMTNSLELSTIASKEENDTFTVTKYINDLGLSGKYYIYLKINGTVYDINQYVEY